MEGNLLQTYKDMDYAYIVPFQTSGARCYRKP